MQNQQPSALDPKFIIAMVCVAAVYFGWQSYLSQKYPHIGQTKAETSVATTEPSSQDVQSSAQGTSKNNAVATHSNSAESQISRENNIPEKIFNFTSNNVEFSITNYGMGIFNYKIKKYSDHQGNPIVIGQYQNHDKLFALIQKYNQKPIVFDLKEQGPGDYIGTFESEGLKLVRTMKFDVEKYSFQSTFSVLKMDSNFAQGFNLVLPDKINKPLSNSFLFPSYEHQDFIIQDANKKDVINFNHSKKDISQAFKAAYLVSIGSQYFASAVLDSSEWTPNVEVNAQINTASAIASMSFGPFNPDKAFEFKQILFAGPKSLEILKASHVDLGVILDHGFFGFISKPLLFVMKFFHQLIHNWGVAIILLTLLVRLCVLPFNLMSFRSMKAMQKIQPMIQSLREKYKDDPMTLNKEMMSLMKEYKANPLGGCLPMLLQIPIFFALYRVIGSSVELYQSPFFGWIVDLSTHDKYYVLPILMGISMFVQQKITPTTLDPVQAKIMLFLPVVFSLFMLNLPSGLTLYMFVSTLFGIIQQKIMMRESNPQPKTLSVQNI